MHNGLSLTRYMTESWVIGRGNFAASITYPPVCGADCGSNHISAYASEAPASRLSLMN
jgi:hypothetical protein